VNIILPRRVTQSAPEDDQTELAYSMDRQVPGHRWSPQLKDRGCDNALPG